MPTTTPEVLPNSASRLPAQFTHFVGRKRELADALRLLSSTRLLTLTGVGGSGKTRLAVELASSAWLDYPDGVSWIELASLNAPDVVPEHIASAFGAREAFGHSATELLVQHIGYRKALLVLDNCEHLVEACAQLADVLLRRCERLTILATSREALGVSGERALLVPPLSLPAPHEAMIPVRAALAEAVQLFVDRAQNVMPSFELNGGNVQSVTRICARLDGIPLAIELAAARVKLLAPDQIAERLEGNFRLLSSGSRTALARHRTLREAIDWSYALLTAQEQVLLQRLAVFSGGFTLESAEAICAGGSLDPFDILDMLSALVDKSLVAVLPAENSTRYRLLETVRQYAQDRLHEAGEADTVRVRHARYFLDLAESAAPYLWGGAADMAWMTRLIEETDNFRAVAEWCSISDPEHVSMLLRMGDALQWFMFARGSFREAREVLTRALTAPVVIDELIRARGRVALAAIAVWQGDTAAAQPMVEPAIPILRQQGDQTSYAYALAMLGAAISLEGDPQRAKPILAESVEAASHQPIRALYAIANYWQGVAARARGEYDLAYASFEAGLRVGREFNNPPSIAHPLNALGRLLLERAEVGDAALAVTMLTEALELHRMVDDRWGIAWCLEGLGTAALALKQPERAVKLLAAAADLRDKIAAPLPPSEKAAIEKTSAAAHQALGATRFAADWAEGSALSLSAAIEYALGENGAEPVVQETITPDPARDVPAAGAEASAAPAAPATPMPAAPATATVPVDLRVHALGPLRIIRGDTTIDNDSWRSSKARELLLFLLCNPEGVTREQIGLALWTDASSAQLRNNFHVTLHRLRKGLGDAGWIEVANDRYRFAPHVRIDFDVDAFQREVNSALRDLKRGNDARDRLHSALALHRGEFLDGERVGDWHLNLRDHLLRLLRDGLHALGNYDVEQQRFAEAAKSFERLIVIDSLDESAYRRLLTCYGKLGDRGTAVRLYQRLVRLLQDELDTDPGPETTAIFQSL